MTTLLLFCLRFCQSFFTFSQLKVRQNRIKTLESDRNSLSLLWRRPSRAIVALATSTGARHGYTDNDTGNEYLFSSPCTD
jgi:hypothetical protein